MNNQLASAINPVTAAAVRAEHPETKLALGNVTELLQEQANVHRLLAAPEGDSLVDAVQYLRSLCLAITRYRLEPIGVHLSFQADILPLEAERCWRLGMAVHELVTNAARHACFGPTWRDQDQAVADAPGSQLHHCGQRVALHAVETGAGARPRSRFDQEPGRSARMWLWPRILILSFGVCAHRTRAAGQQGGRVAPRQNAASTEDDPFDPQPDRDSTARESRRHPAALAWADSGIERPGRSPTRRGCAND
jgi:hypothetical protein